MRYNVAGGGDSALYGVESASYYLRNGANQLTVVLPLALIGFPLLLLLSWLSGAVRRPAPRLLLALSPAYLWLAALSLLPHKEERFLYVVYPLVRCATSCPFQHKSACYRVSCKALAALSLLLHKEMRFLYVVYPPCCGRPPPATHGIKRQLGLGI